MRVFEPGTLPQEIFNELSDDIKSKVYGCHISLADNGMILYVVNPDHVLIQAIVGSGTKASLALRQYEGHLPIFFIGHTPRVNDWAQKHFEVAGTLYRYKRRTSWVKSSKQLAG